MPKVTGTVRKKNPVSRVGKRTTTASKVRRLREWLWWMWELHEPCCEFCGEAIPVDDILLGDARDGVLLHHEDADRLNDSPGNLKLAHRTCHRAFHRNHMWNGKRWVKAKTK